MLKAVLRPLDALGALVVEALAHIGSALLLLVSASGWLVRAIFTRKVRLGHTAMITQIIRVGVRSVFIISLVSASVGLILSLQMAPPLEQLGQQDKLANIIGVAVFRELGPLISAIVLIGFAGAAITAEIGTMVVGEEIEALEAHALNPVRFLVVPRVIATLLSMTALAIFANVVAIAASIFISMTAIGLTFSQYWDNMLFQVRFVDFYTGVIKAAVFGLLIGFAGAAITAEIGTMVVGEEIEALEAHALNPVRFLVVPRVIATLLSMTALAIFANVVAIAASIFISMTAIGLTFSQYWDNMLFQVRFVDFYTGVIKAAVFGLLIGVIACANGLSVTGGAAGVGRATTATVVQCVVAVVVADLVFTAVFYIFGLV